VLADVAAAAALGRVLPPRLGGGEGGCGGGRADDGGGGGWGGSTGGGDAASAVDAQFRLHAAAVGSVLSVRVDPDGAWAAAITVQPPAACWEALLVTERDALSQWEPCRGLTSSVRDVVPHVDVELEGAVATLAAAVTAVAAAATAGGGVGGGGSGDGCAGGDDVGGGGRRRAPPPTRTSPNRT